MDSALEPLFNNLQHALDELRAGVEAKQAKEQSEAQERTVRRQASVGSCTKQDHRFRISSITTPRFFGLGPWTVKWIETDGITTRRWENEFYSRIEAEQLINELLQRKNQERERD